MAVYVEEIVPAGPALNLENLALLDPASDSEEEKTEEEAIAATAAIKRGTFLYVYGYGKSVKCSRKLMDKEMNYSHRDIPIKEECRICLSPLAAGETVRRLECLHVFHRVCLDTWLQRCLKCPLCKHDLMSAQVIVKKTNISLFPFTSMSCALF